MVVVLINHSENPVTLPAGPSLPWYDTATMSSAVDITDDTPVTVDFGSSIVLDEFDVHVYQYIQPVKAWDPSPVDSAGGVSGDVVLSWKAGRYADSHDVFFGGTFNDVNDATADFLTGDVDQSSCVDMNDLSVMADQWLTDGSSVPSANLNGDSIVNFEDFAKMAEYWLQCGVYYGNQTETTYDPDGTLEPGTYYWRIDEVNDPNVWKGDIWQFTVPVP